MQGVKLPFAFQLMLKSFYPGLELKRIQDTETETKSYFEVQLHKYRLTTFATYELVVIVIAVSLASAITFWHELLIEESSTCEDGYDCFMVRDGHIWAERVNTDCITVDNVTAQELNGTDRGLWCYRFTFDYFQAFVATGGVTVTAEVMVNTVMFFIISVIHMSKFLHIVAIAILSIFLHFIVPVTICIGTAAKGYAVAWLQVSYLKVIIFVLLCSMSAQALHLFAIDIFRSSWIENDPSPSIKSEPTLLRIRPIESD